MKRRTRPACRGTAALAGLALLLAPVVAGCPGAAKLRLYGGETVQGRILRADERTVWVQEPPRVLEPRARCHARCRRRTTRMAPDLRRPYCEARCGASSGDRVISRGRIEEVSHPGKAPTIAGSVMAAVGLALVIAGGVDNQQARNAPPVAPGIDRMLEPRFGPLAMLFGTTLLVPGAVMLLTGAPRYAASKNRYEPSRD